MTAIKWEDQWPEVFTFFLLVLGFLISVFVRSAAFSYITIFFAGAVAARGFYMRRYKEPILPFILLIIGFLIGYLAGSIWANRFLALLLFLIGFGLSYYLHLKKIITIFKSKSFIK
ncbi:hypothetical protein COV20_05200 [Candidatus Woesearchaeota archaeon CG10_big_fil_rev_8_21_14_0_10_45_16]|nr:MAG: hypothetical protein COV20_05200 [Candidatus Woesearchaeota archaeon CG10_big_fil_rev_8_21_14_0_10_45_16]